MLRTEDEARKAWCPLARQLVTIESKGGETVGPIQNASANRFMGDAASVCIASECMAWRWGDGPLGHPQGYCGAFGRPERD